jgi:hypothetical protein
MTPSTSPFSGAILAISYVDGQAVKDAATADWVTADSTPDGGAAARALCDAMPGCGYVVHYVNANNQCAGPNRPVPSPRFHFHALLAGMPCATTFCTTRASAPP